MTHLATGLSAIDAIRQRTSVRSYAPDKIDRAVINTLLAAAIRAPTAIHEEPWAFAVIQDKSLLKRLSDEAKPLFLPEIERSHSPRARHLLSEFANPAFNIFHNANTLIVIYGNSSGHFSIPDCWLAAENLMIAACAMGLGTCVIGSAVSGLNSKPVREELNTPDDMHAIAPIVVGVPLEKSMPGPRKEARVLFWK